ncbi:MAG: hypothetical protein AAGI37_09875 [Planctomycetota bacterium]
MSAIRGTGVIQDAMVIIDGPTDGRVFLAYTERCLAYRCDAVTLSWWTTRRRQDRGDV